MGTTAERLEEEMRTALDQLLRRTSKETPQEVRAFLMAQSPENFLSLWNEWFWKWAREIQHVTRVGPRLRPTQRLKFNIVLHALCKLVSWDDTFIERLTRLSRSETPLSQQAKIQINQHYRLKSKSTNFLSRVGEMKPTGITVLGKKPEPESKEESAGVYFHAQTKEIPRILKKCCDLSMSDTLAILESVKIGHSCVQNHRLEVTDMSAALALVTKRGEWTLRVHHNGGNNWNFRLTFLGD